MQINGLTPNQAQLAKNIVSMIDATLAAGAPLRDISIAIHLASIDCAERLAAAANSEPASVIAVAQSVPPGVRVIREGRNGAG